MAHWEEVVPIGKLGLCGGRSMSSSDCACSEPGDATSLGRATSAPNLGVGIGVSMASLDAAEVLTASSAPLVG